MKQRKVIIIVIIAVMLLVSGFVLLNKNGREDDIDKTKYNYIIDDSGTKTNTSKALKQSKSYMGLEIKNTTIETAIDNSSVVAMNISNSAEEIFVERWAKIEFLTEKGDSFQHVLVFIPTLAPEEEQLVSVSLTYGELVNFYDIKVVDVDLSEPLDEVKVPNSQ